MITSVPWQLPAVLGLGLPPVISTYGEHVDTIYHVIFYVTGAVFVAVETLLVYFLVRYRARPGGKAIHSHGNQTAEIVWTITPAVILVLLAVFSNRTWGEIRHRFPKDADQVQIAAKQFAWGFWYPGPDGKWGTGDEIFAENQLHVVVGKPVVARLNSVDVIHSFFLPYVRLKQDAVPGLKIKVWFDAKVTTKEMRERLRPELEPCFYADRARAREEEIPRRIKAAVAKAIEAACDASEIDVDSAEGRALADKVGPAARASAETEVPAQVDKEICAKAVREELKRKKLEAGSEEGKKVAADLTGNLDNAQHVLAAVDVDNWTYEVVCAELCGLGHYRMRGYMTVETEEEFQAWQKEQDKITVPEQIDLDKLRKEWKQEEE